MFGKITRIDNVGNGNTGRIMGDAPDQRAYHFVCNELIDLPFEQSSVGQRVAFNVKGTTDAIMIRLAE